MQLDNRILLMGRGIDAVEAFDRGTAAGQNALAARQNVDLTNLYRAQGANILAGDQNALNALAGISPEAAFTMQTNRQLVQDNAFNMEQAKVQAARETEAHLAKLDAGKAAQEAAELRSMAEAATLANSPEQWQQVFAGTPYEGAWDNRAAVLEILGTQKSVVDRLFPALDPVEPLSPEGKVEFDRARGFLPPVAEVAPINVEAEEKLRKEYNALGEVKDFKSQTAAFASLQSAAQRAAGEKNGAADIALVFAFMKTLDPTSTVREGEFAAAARSGSFGDTIQNIVSKIESGEILTDEQRANFVETAARIYSGGRNTYRDTLDTYRGIAGDQGLDLTRTVPDYNPTAPLVSQRPASRGNAPVASSRWRFDPETGEWGEVQ